MTYLTTESVLRLILIDYCVTGIEASVIYSVADCIAVMLQGFRTLLSSPWYINLGRYAGDDWAQYYEVEPLSFNVSCLCTT